MLPSLIGIIASSGGAGVATSYESIATATAGGGGSSSFTFSSIPSTYQHLQLRGIARATTGTTGGSFIAIRLNSDSAANYSYHFVYGNGSSAGAFGTGGTSEMVSQRFPRNGDGSSSTFGTSVIEILDYANTNKYKTLRSLGGFDANGSGEVYLDSGSWRNTNAVTSITLDMYDGDFAQYSSFALYGIKG